MRGRGYVVLLFLLLGGYHTWGYFVTEDYAKRAYVAHEVSWFIITTGLFVGIFCRQNGARYILIALQLFRLGATLVFLPAYVEPMMHSFDLLVSMLSGQRMVVEGDGVVGEFPRLEPGEHFSYNSYHTIGSDSVAEGAYFGVTADGELVFTRIPRFEMRVPVRSV